MHMLRRLAIAGILVASCSGDDPTGPYVTCSASYPDTMTQRWPESLTLVLGAVDDVIVDRWVDDGCSGSSLSIPGFGAVVRDSTVAVIEETELPTGARVTAVAPGSTRIVFEGADYADSILVTVPDTFALGDVASIAAEGEQTCAVEVGGRVLCWGAPTDVDLYGGPLEAAASVGTCFGTPCSPMPRPIGRTAEEIALGPPGRFCFTDASGTACREGGTVEFVGADLQDLTLGIGHACGLDAVGDAYCWGQDYFGQVGVGERVNGARSLNLVKGGLTWTSIHARDDTTCGATAEGHLYCWGLLPEGVGAPSICEVSPGYKGSGPTSAPCADEPWRIPLGGGLGSDTLVAAVEGSCLLTTGGGALCQPAGLGSFSRIADAGTFETLRSGWTHTCGLTSAGAALCWGGGGLGQLGDGFGRPSATPVSVAGGHVFVSLALGGEHSCGLTDAAEVLCWGANFVGQVTGSILKSQPVPVKVRGQAGP